MATRDPDLLIIDGLEAGGEWGQDVVADIHAGLDAVLVAPLVWEDSAGAFDDLGKWRRRFLTYADSLMPVRRSEDVLTAKRLGKTGVIYGFQNASPIEDNLDYVWTFHELGVRSIQLTYNNQNLIGGGCYEAEDSGLSRFGRSVVTEMNEAGILVDLSHVGERTSIQAIQHSSKPVAITHANPRRIHEHPRNKSDEVLHALADSGGVIGLTPFPRFAGKLLSIDEWCDVIARTVDVVGIDHVAIGTDMARGWADMRGHIRWIRNGRWSHDESELTDSYPAFPDWLANAAAFPSMAASLRDRGFEKSEVLSVLGGNWFRLFQQVIG